MDIINELEVLGIVGPAAGSKPREVFIKTEEEFERLFTCDEIEEEIKEFSIAKNDFYDAFDVKGDFLFWFSNSKESGKGKIDLLIMPCYLNNDFVLEMTLITGEKYKLSKGTILKILFDDGRVLTYEIKHEVIGNTLTRISVQYNEMLFFEKTQIKVVLLDFKKNNTQVQVHPNDSYNKAVKTHSNFLKKVIELNPKCIQEKTINVDEINLGCYVYLMVDRANSFYKIGLSNNPNFRESTLQSEKPTIEIIVSKKFINRKIASIFEKTLHTTYETKRIRGEWFNLDISELNEVIAILSS